MKEPSTTHRVEGARRVVTGLSEAGRSTIVSDGPSPSCLVTPGNTKSDIWRITAVPAPLLGSDGLGGALLTLPPPAGVVHRVVIIPPDSAWDRSQGYRDELGPLPGMVAEDEADGIPGLHYTDTVDFVTVLSGELVAVLQDATAVLRPGDTIVMRGVAHSWSNPTAEPATIVSVMIAGLR